MTASPPSPAGWTCVCGSARGDHHARRGLPNQDAVACSRNPGTGNLVVAVSDGHGAPRYVRSDVGARMAVSLATRVGAGLSAADESPAEIEERLRASFLPELVGLWTDAVEAHADAHPLTAEEQRRAPEVRLAADGAVAYGATLLVAIVTGGPTTAFVRIGDGDVLAVGAGGTLSLPVPADRDLVAGVTASLCTTAAVRDARVATMPSEEIDVLLLASDGYGNAFSSGDWRQVVAADVHRLLHGQGLDVIAHRLPDWLEQAARASGDDVTVAVVARPGEVVPAPDRGAVQRPA